jgi:Ca2+:H+ antiporter
MPHDVERGLLKKSGEVSATGDAAVEAGGDDDEEEEEEDILGFRYSIFWLVVITIVISFLSDALVETIQVAAKQCKVPGVFLSTIVIPIVGNAAEHAGSIMFAMKNKLDLSLGVAVGSSTQVALMIVPLLVLLGWCMNKDMTLDFSAFEAITLFLSVIIVTFAISHGRSNWLVGALLIGAYLIISIGFWVHDDEKL